MADVPPRTVGTAMQTYATAVLPRFSVTLRELGTFVSVVPGKAVPHALVVYRPTVEPTGVAALKVNVVELCVKE